MAPIPLDRRPARPVLIVDDNPDVREVLSILLGLRKFAVRTAIDGREGLRELRREPRPTAVLLDLHMPGVNGFGFRAEQRKHADLMAIPVILYSGDLEVAQAAAEMGIEAYLQKPFDVDEIVELLVRHTDAQARRHVGRG